MRCKCEKIVLIFVGIQAALILQVAYIGLIPMPMTLQWSRTISTGAIIGVAGRQFIKTDVKRMQYSSAQNGLVDKRGEFNIVYNLMVSERVQQHLYDDDDITLASQTSIHNLHHLVHLSKHWKGPISLAVLAVNSDDVVSAIDTISNLRRCFYSIRQNASFHLVHPLNHSIPQLDIAAHTKLINCADYKSIQKEAAVHNFSYKGLQYPVNLLRNVARAAVLTEFIFVVDIDMIPNAKLHEDFQKFSRENSLMGHGAADHTVYVAPVFETKEPNYLPHDKKKLIPFLKNETIRPFYWDLCSLCQGSFNQSKWLQFTPHDYKMRAMYEVPWKSPWEPIYISRKAVPRYDERFKQFGYNRISQACELHMAGYHFSILNNAFLLHQGFKTPSSFHISQADEQQQNKKLFLEFQAEMRRKYRKNSYNKPKS